MSTNNDEDDKDNVYFEDDQYGEGDGDGKNNQNVEYKDDDDVDNDPSKLRIIMKFHLKY